MAPVIANEVQNAVRLRGVSSAGSDNLLWPKGRLTGGEVQASIHYQGYVYIAAGGQLLIAELSREGGIQAVHRINFPTKIRGLVIETGFLYVLDQHYGLFVFDLERPQKPLQTDNLNLHIYGGHLSAQKGWAYVAHGRGFSRVDISNPQNLRLDSGYRDQALWVSPWAGALVAFEGIARSINIFDAGMHELLGSRPALERSDYLPLVSRDSTAFIGFTTGRTVSAEETAYTASVASYGFGGPNYVFQAGQIDLPGQMQALALAGDTLFTAVNTDLYALSTGEADSLSVAYAHPAVLSVGNTALEYVSPFVIAGYASEHLGRGGVEVLNVSGAADIQSAGGVETSFPPFRALALDGKKLWANKDGGGLVLVDVTDIARPRIVREYDIELFGNLHVQGNYLYGLFQSGLVVYEMDKEKNLKQVGQLALDTSGATTLSISGSVAVVGFPNQRSFHVVDISKPSLPVRLAEIDGLPIEDVFIREDLLFISSRHLAAVFDLSTPAEPIELWSRPSQGMIPSGNGTLFFSWENDRLISYRNSDSGRIEELAGISVPGPRVRKMETHGNLLLIAVFGRVWAEDSRLLVYEFSDSGDIKLVGSTPTGPELIWDIAVNDDCVVYSDKGVSLFENPHTAHLTAVQMARAQPSSLLNLAPNYPNPFNAQTVLKYDLSAEAKTELGIFNLGGQKVTTLINSQLPAGKYQTQWDGKDQFGRPMASGIYLARLKSGDNLSVRKLVLAR